MKRFSYLAILALLILSSCKNYYDKGKEYKIIESKENTAFQELEFENSEICKECHALIYNEFITSQHAKSSLANDSIFEAVWKQHPDHLSGSKYECAQCHNPASDNLKNLIQGTNNAKPDYNNVSENQGVSCAACHRIKSIETHRKANKAIYSKDTHTYYGIGTGMSHVHENKNDNKLYFNGEVCKACHSHRENTKGYLIGITESKSENPWETCVTCHMPLTEGTGTFKKMDRTHFNHSFPGAHNNQHLLEKHLIINLEENPEKNLVVSIKNKAPHDLFIQAFRVAFLKVKIIRNNKTIQSFEPIVLEKVLANKNGESLEIFATKEIKNDFLKGSELKLFSFEYKIQKGDEVEIELGYKLLKDNFLEQFELKNSKASEYKMLKNIKIVAK